jgi:DNA-binding NarL/FixJ family response regulator
MTIHVHVACDDTLYRNVITDFLHHQHDMVVVGASTGGDVGAAALELEDADVVVLGLPKTADATHDAAPYRELPAGGEAVVAFCMTREQADDCHEIGIERTIGPEEPARRLAAAVRAAYTAGHGNL